MDQADKSFDTIGYYSCFLLSDGLLMSPSISSLLNLIFPLLTISFHYVIWCQTIIYQNSICVPKKEQYFGKVSRIWCMNSWEDSSFCNTLKKREREPIVSQKISLRYNTVPDEWNIDRIISHHEIEFAYSELAIVYME